MSNKVKDQNNTDFGYIADVYEPWDIAHISESTPEYYAGMLEEIPVTAKAWGNTPKEANENYQKFRKKKRKQQDKKETLDMTNHVRSERDATAPYAAMLPAAAVAGPLVEATAAVAPMFAPGTAGGNFIGNAAKDMLAYELGNRAFKTVTGTTPGELIRHYADYLSDGAIPEYFHNQVGGDVAYDLLTETPMFGLSAKAAPLVEQAVTLPFKKGIGAYQAYKGFQNGLKKGVAEAVSEAGNNFKSELDWSPESVFNKAGWKKEIVHGDGGYTQNDIDLFLEGMPERLQIERELKETGEWERIKSELQNAAKTQSASFKDGKLLVEYRDGYPIDMREVVQMRTLAYKDRFGRNGVDFYHVSPETGLSGIYLLDIGSNWGRVNGLMFYGHVGRPHTGAMTKYSENGATPKVYHMVTEVNSPYEGTLIGDDRGFFPFTKVRDWGLKQLESTNKARLKKGLEPLSEIDFMELTALNEIETAERILNRYKEKLVKAKTYGLPQKDIDECLKWIDYYTADLIEKQNHFKNLLLGKDALLNLQFDVIRGPGMETTNDIGIDFGNTTVKSILGTGQYSSDLHFYRKSGGTLNYLNYIK